jgi:hypothetical protein
LHADTWSSSLPGHPEVRNGLPVAMSASSTTVA